MFVADILVPAVLVGAVLQGWSTYEVLPAAALTVAAALAYIAFVLLVVRPMHLIRSPPIPFRPTRYQKAADFPPPFPNGWFFVCLDADLKDGEVRELQILGRAMVLFRSHAKGGAGRGQVSILDAFCPHLGANLGVSGEVDRSSNCLKCCFHGWQFDHDGKCVKIEGTDVIPPNAHIKRTYHVSVTNGAVYLWHDAEDREPQFPLIDRPEINSGGYYLGAQATAVVNAHVQELPENGPDVAHLNVLHRNFVLDWMPSSLAIHKWTASWSPDTDRPYATTIQIGQCIKVAGSYTLPGTTVRVTVKQIGPGIVSLDFFTPLGHLILYECVTPTRVTTQQVRHVLFCAPTVPRAVAKVVMWSTQQQFDRDVPIWCSKRYTPAPILSKADGPIMAFRRWYRQFYSTSSVSFPDALAQETMFDW